jgi:transposase
MKPKTDSNTASLAVVGVDIGKEVFHIVGLGVDGKIAFRRKIRRLGLEDAFQRLPPCIVGMEACLSAHFISRVLRALGHEPRIIPAIYVKPFMKGQKNDYNDAEAIAEAALRPNLRTVREKSQDQLDLQACHRVRSRLVSRRTATINQIRAFLIEQGIAVRAGARTLRNSLFAILENRKDEISPRTAKLILGLYEDWCHLDKRDRRTQPWRGDVPAADECAWYRAADLDRHCSCDQHRRSSERGRDFGARLGLVPDAEGLLRVELSRLDCLAGRSDHAAKSVIRRA